MLKNVGDDSFKWKLIVEIRPLGKLEMKNFPHDE